MSGYIQRRDELLDHVTRKRVGYIDLDGQEQPFDTVALQALVSEYGNAPATIDASNAASVNGATMTLAAGATLTVDAAAWAALTAGIIINVGQSGSATLAFSGGAVKENSSGTSSSSVTLSASGVYALVKSPSGSAKFRLSGGASL